MIVINEAIVQLKHNDIHTKIPIANVLISELLKYHTLIATFKDNITNNDFAIDFKYQRYEIEPYPDMTFSTWWSSYVQGDLSKFTIIEKIPFIKNMRVGFGDIYEDGMNIDLDNELYLIDANTTDELNTLVNYENNAVVAIDSYLHPLYKSGDKIFIREGKNTLAKSEHAISIMTFKMFDDTKVIPITTSMLSSNASSQRYTDTVYVDLNIDITGYLPLLVVGGYIHMLDNSYVISSHNSIEIDIKKLNLREKFIRSFGILNLSTISTSDTLNIEYAKSDDFVIKYLSHPLSFVILVKTDNYKLTKTKLEYTHITNRYDYKRDNKPNYPLISRHNETIPYIAKKDGDRWTLDIHKSKTANLLMNTSMLDLQAKMDTKRVSSNPLFDLPLYFYNLEATKLI